MTHDRSESEPRLPAGAEEALELLLPDADERRRTEAERVAGFLRLLQADASRAGERVSVDLTRARDDLARSGRERLEGALNDLCAHHLAALLDPDRFLHPGEASRPAAQAWRELESLREEYDGLAELPVPGEPVSAVAARLIESLARHAGEASAALWHARLVGALRGPRDGEAAFRELASAAGDAEVPPAVWAGAIECALDAGAVHRAADLASECATRHPHDARLARLLVWCRLLAGDFEAARALDARLGAWKGDLPGVLSRLRDELPSCLALLSGRTRRSTAQHDLAPPLEAELDRTALGAQLVAVVQLHPGAGAELIAFDAAPGLRARVERWFEDRDRAASRPSNPEHRVLRDARAQAWHRTDGAALPDSLGGADSRAALLQPILDDAGETCGWLHLESSHHLLPTTRRMEALARAWRFELLRRRGRWEAPDDAEVFARVDDDRGEVARAFHELVARLGIKTARRAWWGFELRDGEPRLVANGGEGLGPVEDAPGRGRALHRALACGGPVRGDEPDANLYLHAQSAAGVVLCLRVAEECIGALVVESERRRDFSASEAERLAELVDADALHVRLAQFHAEHRRRHGRAVIADADSTGFRAFHAALRRARSASAPLVLCGPSGAGKRVFARWAWFESGAAEARRESTIRDWLADGARGPAYLTGLEQADAHDQLCLLRTLEDGADARDLAFGTREHPGCAARDGRLLPELSAWLGRELHFVPGFAQRREELSLLVEARLAELSCESARPLPHLDDGALALLWRQDWTGNWRELDARLHRLLQRETADEVTSDELAEIWRAAGDEAVARIPSREPSAELLQAALLSTATAGGRANKRRAALYLGWDPDTLAARLAEADLSAIDPSARGAAWSRRRSAAGGR